MIVRDRLSLLDVMFTLRGSIVPLIAARVAVIAAISTAVTLVDHFYSGWLPRLPPTLFSLLGIAISIFLGFRNSACYDRWWEARKQWGLLVTEARCLARAITVMLPERSLQDRACRRIIGFAHALAARLRGQDVPEAALAFLPQAEAGSLPGRKNPPDTILRAMSADFADCLRRGDIGEVGFATLEARVVALAGVQAACERIRTTPTPFAYTLLVHRTAWLFCILLPFALIGAAGDAAPLIAATVAYAFFGLDALGDELEEPFAVRSNTIPMNALTRLIEIEILEGLGETNLPAPLEPVDYLLR